MNKHIPIRTCVICRGKVEKSGMQRYVVLVSEDGIVSIERGTVKGRGYYHCSSVQCMEQFPLLKWYRKRKKGAK